MERFSFLVENTFFVDSPRKGESGVMVKVQEQ